MDKVYILMEEPHYEPGEVLKVFFNKETALDHLLDISGKRDNFDYIDARRWSCWGTALDYSVYLYDVDAN